MSNVFKGDINNPNKKIHKRYLSTGNFRTYCVSPTVLGNNFYIDILVYFKVNDRVYFKCTRIS